MSTELPQAHRRIPPGGTSDPNVIELVEKLRSKFEHEYEGDVKQLKPIEFADQVVAGKNYFVKVQVNGDKYVLLRKYERAWENHLELAAWKEIAKDENAHHFEKGT